MEAMLRAAFMYLFLLLVIRTAGKRTLAEITTFDFVLLLIIGEASQQGITGNDYSVTNAVVIIITLVFLDILLSLLKQYYWIFEKWMDGTPLIIVENGKPLRDRMKKVRVNESDVMESARKLQGLERMEQIKYAVLEKDGGITIIPKEEFK